MPYYNFVAKDHQGRNLAGSLFGATEQAVFFRLQQLGYVVLSVTEKTAKDTFELFPQRVTIEDIVVFSRLMSTVIDTGLPAVDALAALEEQTENTTFRKIIRRIREDVEQGSSLSRAFEKHPKVFPHFFISMVRSGEAGGNLPQVLEHLCVYMEKDQDLKRNLKTAFTYPKFILILMAFLISFLFVKVFPVLRDFYAEAPDKIKIPQATKMLLDGTQFVYDNWKILAMAAAFIVIGFSVFRKHPRTRPIYDEMVMKIPRIGPLNRRIMVTRTIRTLGSMLACGVPLITSLESVKNLTNNYWIDQDLTRVIDSVETGGTVSSPLRLSKSFPPLAIYMIAVGEHSGRLPQLLNGCADAMDKEIDHLIKQLLIALEPAMIVVIAIIVAFLAIALYLPVFSSFTMVS